MYSLPEPACLPAALYRDRLPLIIVKNAMLGRNGRCSRKKKVQPWSFFGCTDVSCQEDLSKKPIVCRGVI